MAWKKDSVQILIASLIMQSYFKKILIISHKNVGSCACLVFNYVTDDAELVNRAPFEVLNLILCKNGLPKPSIGYQKVPSMVVRSIFQGHIECFDSVEVEKFIHSCD